MNIPCKFRIAVSCYGTQSSSNELSTLVSDSAKCKQTKANIKSAIIPELTYFAEMLER